MIMVLETTTLESNKFSKLDNIPTSQLEFVFPEETLTLFDSFDLIKIDTFDKKFKFHFY